MRARWPVVAAVAVALVVGLGLGAVLFGGDGGDDGTTVSPTTAGPAADGTSTSAVAQGPAAPTSLPDLPATTVPEAGLEGAALELAQAINRAHQLTYHIVLRGSDADSTTETELWRRLPSARRDARLGSGEARLETREFRSPSLGHLACLIDTSGSGQTTCLQAPPGELDPADPVLGAVDPAAGTVTASDDTVGGVPVRCFSVAMPDATVHVACFDGDGIPAVLDGGDGRLERVGTPARGVADDVFVPPESSIVSSGAGTTGTTATTAGP